MNIEEIIKNLIQDDDTVKTLSAIENRSLIVQYHIFKGFREYDKRRFIKFFTKHIYYRDIIINLLNEIYNIQDESKVNKQYELARQGLNGLEDFIELYKSIDKNL